MVLKFFLNQKRGHTDLKPCVSTTKGCALITDVLYFIKSLLCTLSHLQPQPSWTYCKSALSINFKSTYLFSSVTWRQITFSVLSFLLSLTLLPSLFSHSAAHSSSLQKASGLSSLPSVWPICDAVWATGLITIGRRNVGNKPTRLKWKTKL